MNTFPKWLVVCVLACLAAVSSQPAVAASDAGKRIENAALVLQEFRSSPDIEVPVKLFKDAAAVAVFPRVLKGAFFIGGKYGRGVISARTPDGSWTAPAFFSLGGGSFGIQFGGEAIDLVLIVRNKRGLESLLKGKVTLGGDVSMAAGPVGRTASAETDILLTAEIWAYSRSKGLFAGVSLKGAVISQDRDSNELFYGKPLDARDILLEGKVQPINEAKDLVLEMEAFVSK